jgi:hypothetical protein
MGLSFTIAAGPRQRSHSQVRVPRDSWLHLLSQIRNSPNLEDQVPVFISLRKKVTQLYPQALGSFFEASYDSQGSKNACLLAPLPSNGSMRTT